MTTDHTSQDDDLQQELSAHQTFSVAGVIGRQAGGAMKGASPIPKLAQVTIEIVQFIDQNLSDPSGALKSLLRRRVKDNGVVMDRNIHTPLLGLREIIQPILEKDVVLHEFVRQVDVRWGQLFQERPHFQQAGQPPHPDDEYTHASVKRDLTTLLATLERARLEDQR